VKSLVRIERSPSEIKAFLMVQVFLKPWELC